MPAAQKSGFLTAYLNLWDAREHLRSALIGALAHAASPRETFCASQEIESSAEEGDLQTTRSQGAVAQAGSNYGPTEASHRKIKLFRANLSSLGASQSLAEAVMANPGVGIARHFHPLQTRFAPMSRGP